MACKGFVGGSVDGPIADGVLVVGHIDEQAFGIVLAEGVTVISGVSGGGELGIDAVALEIYLIVAGTCRFVVVGIA